MYEFLKYVQQSEYWTSAVYLMKINVQTAQTAYLGHLGYYNNSNGLVRFWGKKKITIWVKVSISSK